MIGRLSQVFQFFAFELFVKFFSKIPQNSHQKVAISRYTMKPSLNVSRNFVLYAQIRAACKKWYKSYGSKKSSVPEKFSLVYSAVSLVNRSSRQDPTRGRKKSGDISPPPSRYRTPECGYGSFGIRRRRACLGMPTDGGRRNAMWRCTNDDRRETW